MGFEGPLHRRVYDAVDPSPTRALIFTQGHYDHVGGVDSVRDEDTDVIAQAQLGRRGATTTNGSSRSGSATPHSRGATKILAAMVYARSARRRQRTPGPTQAHHDLR